MIGQTISYYRILEKLGEGGMGIVYKALDTKLKRTVALKFLPLELTSDPEAKKRFIQEAQAASALNHPNICGIHTIEEFENPASVSDDGTSAGKQQFIDMEFVEGKTLSVLLNEKELSLKEVLDIALPIAEGLNAAHKKGIVHRDIKPDNIMVTDERLVKIMDFGLAKLKGTSKLTKTHSTLGTLSYMSPEQAQGEEVDQRSDIFSLGALLYEMITGRRPFKGEHEAAIMYSLLNETPEPLARYKSDLPTDLQRVIDKALSKDKSERYQHVDEMLADLKSIKRQSESGIITRKSASPFKIFKIPWYIYASVGIIILILILDKVFFVARPEKPISSIAVLPFQNFSKDTEQEYFSDGMTEALISELSKIKALRVISRTSIMRFKKTDKSLPEIAGELGVDAIVEGSVQKVQEEVRITAQLVKAKPEQHLWTNDFTRNIRNILILQSEIAQAIANEIKIAVTVEEKTKFARSRPVDPDAYEAYLKGRFFINKFNEVDVRKGISYFEQAIARDSSYALAYAGLAEGYDYLWSLGIMSAKDAFPKIKTWARKALSIDEFLADAYVILGDVESAEWNWQDAEENFKLAIQLNQNHANVHFIYGAYLVWMKRNDEAFREMKRSLELDPLSLFAKTFFALMLFLNHQEDSAITQMNDVLSIDSNYVYGIRILGSFYSFKRNFEYAIALYQKAISLGDYPSLAFVAWTYASSGNSVKAREILADIKMKYVPPGFIAIVYIGLGEWDHAYECLERAYNEHDQSLLSIISLPSGYDVNLDRFRTDRRFQALVKKMGLR